MRLTILGSGTNVHPTRAAAGYLVQTDHTFLLDFGPRTLGNLIKVGLNRHRITHILFSHYHADHFSELMEALKDPKSAAELLSVLFRRPLDAHQTFFAMGEAIAHLHYLYYADQVRRAVGADGVMRYARA